jgi:glutaredoxin-like protein NrdH
MTVVRVPGRDAGQIMLYALSTCGWCAKTKKLLDDLGVEYDFEYVDHLQGEEREKAIQEVKNWNPSCSFPTLVINEETCIVGYKEDEIRGALEP